MYLHPLPPPPLTVDFASHLIPSSSSSVSATHLTRTTQLREALRNVLADGQATAASKGSSSGSGTIEIRLVQAIEEYLPCLVGIFNSCQADQLIWRSEPLFAWFHPLSPSLPASSSSKLSMGASSYSRGSDNTTPATCRSVLFELDQLLILYSLALSNLAVLQALSVGEYEYSPTISEAERKEKEASLKRGVAYGKKAVGIIDWLLGEGSQRSRDGRSGEEAWSEHRERERRTLLQGLFILHQLPPTLLTIRLLLSAAACQISSTQQLPPPLPTSHPSPSLLAKIHLEVPRLADEARVVLETCSQVGAASDRNGGPPSSTGSSSLSSKFKSLGFNKKNEAVSVNQPQGGTGQRNFSDSSGPSGSPVVAPSALYPDSRGRNGSPSAPAVSSNLLRYLATITKVYRSVVYTYLSLEAGEAQNGGSATGGSHAEAIVWSRIASRQLESLEKKQLERFIGRSTLESDTDGAQNSNGSKNSSSSSSRFSRKPFSKDKDSNNVNSLEVSSDSSATNPSSKPTHPLTPRLYRYHNRFLSTHRDTLSHIQNIYTRLNESISFQKLPMEEDLLSTKVPGPRAVLTFDSKGTDGWSMPRGEFGLGSGIGENASLGGEGAREGGGSGLIGSASGQEEAGYANRNAYY